MTVDTDIVDGATSAHSMVPARELPMLLILPAPPRVPGPRRPRCARTPSPPGTTGSSANKTKAGGHRLGPGHYLGVSRLQRYLGVGRPVKFARSKTTPHG